METLLIPHVWNQPAWLITTRVFQEKDCIMTSTATENYFLLTFADLIYVEKMILTYFARLWIDSWLLQCCLHKPRTTRPPQQDIRRKKCQIAFCLMDLSKFEFAWPGHQQSPPISSCETPRPVNAEDEARWLHARYQKPQLTDKMYLWTGCHWSDQDILRKTTWVPNRRILGWLK